MKKILLATMLFVGVAVSGFAQKKGGSNFSVGVEAGIPVGTTSNAYSFVIGGSLKYEAPIATGTNFTLTAGYSSFQGKTIGTYKVPAAGFVPVKAGIKYFFADAFYGEAQLGAAFSTQSGGGTAFAYSPGIGYKFSDVIDLGVRYEAWSKNGTTSQIGARLGFSF